MSKRSRAKNRARKRRQQFASSDPNVIIHIDSISATLMKMPQYNGYQCRGGIHGDTKYNRRKIKAETRRILYEDY
jgi:hypothetical protein